ncbi:cytochrome P450 [Ascodesmis nigricans]|uniref:Cytochrome P450 n=1 Tax=Ascodesmis nigricans TaxID=341454 RepID=A0A4S2MU11_9PEZI|nr:cytochrome P450 [Ascodesmis nigricans]
MTALTDTLREKVSSVPCGDFTPLLLIPLLLILTILYHRTRNAHVPRYPDPFGLMFIYGAKKAADRKDVPFWFASLFDRYGETFVIPSILGKTSYATMAPENIKTFLSTSFNSWALGKLREQAFEPLLGKGIFTQDGGEWSHSRKLLRPQFQRRELEGLGSIHEHIGKMVELIPDGEVVDMQPLVYRLTLDTATEFLFGETAGSLDSTDKATNGQGFADAFNTAQSYIVWRFRVGKILNTLFHSSEGEDAIRRCHSYVDQYIFRNTQKPLSQSGRYVFLDSLKSEETDPFKLRCQSLHVLLAGRDTTAGTLGWTFMLLAQHPQVWKKLKLACEVLPKEPGFSELKDIPYLRHVIAEVLRLYPSVPSNGRVATQDTILPHPAPGIKVKKGEFVRYSPMAMQRRKDIWGEDADEFRPERWEEEGLMQRVGSWGYLPFNGGPRVCLGQQFALMEASAVVQAVVRSFEGVEYCGGEMHVVEPALTMAPAASVVRFWGKREVEK